MYPGASVSGYYLWHPEAHYFGVGRIERDQLEDYARRKGVLARRSRALAASEPRGRDVSAAMPGTGGDARARFHARLAGGPLLADGAMGTLLFSRGIPQRAILDELVATRPELIGAIHREYLAAGADVIETATFGANRIRLAPYGLADRAGRLARRGAQLAREARDVAGRDALVAGSIGPLGGPTRDTQHPADTEVRAVFRETIEGLLEGGVDVFWFETFSPSTTSSSRSRRPGRSPPTCRSWPC